MKIERIYLLESLSKDESVWVRMRVASNPCTPKNVLETLSNDEDSWVRRAAKNNPNYTR